MIGVIYARFSEGPNQTEQSIEGQVSVCMDYAAKNNIKVIKVYADRKISGRSVAGRDEFIQMITDAEKGLFDCIIVYKIDRFGRSREDIAFNKYKLRKVGVKLLYAAETIPEGPEGILLESLMEGMAEYYSAELSQKIVRGMKESAKKGRLPWNCIPLGFDYGEDKRPVENKAAAATVTEAFRLYANGASIKEVVKLFNDRGILTKKGGKINYSIIYRMLRNKSYLGEIDMMGVKVPIRPLTDPATFELVQRRNQDTPSRNAAGKAKTNYLLSCKCYCGYCGGLLIGEAGTSRHGSVYHYYKCSKKKRKEARCTLRNMRKSDLEHIVTTATIRDVLRDEVLDQLIRNIMTVQEEERKQDPLAVIKKKIQTNKKKQANLLDAIENTGSRALVERLSVLEEEADALALEYDICKMNDHFIPETAIRYWFDQFKNGNIENEEFVEALMNTFVSRVDVIDTELTIHYNIAGLGSDTKPSVDWIFSVSSTVN